MNDKEIQDKVIKGMYKIFDKLEQLKKKEKAYEKQ